MAATTSIKEVNGASPGTPTSITELIFCSKDLYNPGNSWGILIPNSGYNYSFRKTIYLNADTTPTTQITNVKFYCDGSIDWTGVEVFIGTMTTYSQATGTDGEGANQDANCTDNIENYTSSSPYSLTGTLSNPDTGKIHDDYLVLQAQASNSALPTTAAETFTFRYDES